MLAWNWREEQCKHGSGRRGGCAAAAAAEGPAPGGPLHRRGGRPRSRTLSRARGVRAAAGRGGVGRAAAGLAPCSASHPTTRKAPRKRKSQCAARPLQHVSRLFRARAGTQGSGRKTLGSCVYVGSVNAGTWLQGRWRCLRPWVAPGSPEPRQVPADVASEDAASASVGIRNREAERPQVPAGSAACVSRPGRAAAGF